MLFNLFFVNLSLQFVWSQHHYDITSFCSFFNTHYLQTSIQSLLFVCGTRSQTYDYVCTRFMEVHCMGMALRTETDDSNSLAI